MSSTLLAENPEDQYRLVHGRQARVKILLPEQLFFQAISFNERQVYRYHLSLLNEHWGKAHASHPAGKYQLASRGKTKHLCTSRCMFWNKLPHCQVRKDCTIVPVMYKGSLVQPMRTFHLI